MFHTKSIRTKLILGCVLLSIIPIMVVTVVLYRTSVNIINKNTAEAIMYNLDSYGKKIDDLFMDIYYEAVEISFDRQLRQLIEDEDYEGLANYLKNRQVSHTYIDSIYLYDEARDRIITSDERKQMIKTNNILTMDHQYGQKKEGYLIDVMERYDYLSNKNYFTIQKELYESKTGTYLGFIQVNVDERTIFYELLHDMVRINNGEIRMINTGKVVVSAKSQSSIGIRMDEEDSTHFITTSRGYELEDGETTMLKVYAVSKVTKYKLIYYIPESSIIQDVKKVNYVAILSTGLAIIAIIGLWYFYTTDIYRPILRLKNQMLKVGEGDFSVQLEHNRKDEMGILMNGFNDMIDKVNNLFNEVYRIRYQKKEAELKALQSQITPHFLYNTLNSIRCVALLQKDKVVSNMLESLINLLRATAGTKQVFVRLEQELKQVENYLNILNFRYNDAFEVIYNVDANVQHYYVPKLIIQPLVENSIQHGIDLRSKEGVIQIKAYETEGQLVIEVNDNGKGITKKDIEGIKENREDKSRNFSGIGVYNVDERIKLYYGQQYGLFYHIPKEGGTRAMITLPVEGEEDMNHAKSTDS